MPNPNYHSFNNPPLSLFLTRTLNLTNTDPSRNPKPVTNTKPNLLPKIDPNANPKHFPNTVPYCKKWLIFNISLTVIQILDYRLRTGEGKDQV